ncbi:thioredoxin family protein [Flavobacteriaceae bacterium SZ-1-7]|uniref:thioredoxin family protein n=1 Tax=Tamlana sedimenti TaxID=3134126 RepID=UPI0031228901
MKNLTLTLFLFVLFSVSSWGQKALIWHTDMNEAFEIASKENKPLMLFFTGSDWCGWCIRLQNEVFKTSDFETWAKENVVLVELDFPRKTALDRNTQIQNYQMQKMFQVRGYPSILFAKPEMMTDGKKNLKNLGRTGYVRGGPDKWLAVADNIVGQSY